MSTEHLREPGFLLLGAGNQTESDFNHALDSIEMAGLAGYDVQRDGLYLSNIDTPKIFHDEKGGHDEDNPEFVLPIDLSRFKISNLIMDRLTEVNESMLTVSERRFREALNIPSIDSVSESEAQLNSAAARSAIRRLLPRLGGVVLLKASSREGIVYTSGIYEDLRQIDVTTTE